jgi:hypothetical protein
MDKTIIAESVEVSVDTYGRVVVAPFEHFDGLTPDEAHDLARALENAAFDAASLWRRRQDTDATRDLLDALDARPDLALMHRVRAGGFGQVYTLDEYEQLKDFLISSFPQGDYDEDNLRLGFEDKAVHRTFKISTPRGGSLSVDLYDTDAERVAEAIRERDAEKSEAVSS